MKDYLKIILLIPFFMKAQNTLPVLDSRVDEVLNQVAYINKNGTSRLQYLEAELISELKKISFNTKDLVGKIEFLLKVLLIGFNDKNGIIPEMFDELKNIRIELNQIKTKTTQSKEEQSTPLFMFEELESMLNEIDDRQKKLDLALKTIDATKFNTKKQKYLKENNEKIKSTNQFVVKIRRWVNKNKENPIPLSTTIFFYNLIKQKKMGLNDLDSILEGGKKNQNIEINERSFIDIINKKD